MRKLRDFFEAIKNFFREYWIGVGCAARAEVELGVRRMKAESDQYGRYRSNCPETAESAMDIRKMKAEADQYGFYASRQ